MRKFLDGVHVCANFHENQKGSRFFFVDLVWNDPCTFGSQGPQNIETNVVHFSIITKDGTQLNLQANGLNQITSLIQKGPLQQLDVEFLQSISSTRLADVLLKSLEMASIDILVGSEFFWSIVNSGRMVLPSGLFLLSSKLGYLFTGKFLDPNSDAKPDYHHQLVAYFVMTHMNQCVSEINMSSAVGTTTTKVSDLSDMWKLENGSFTCV